MSSFADFDTSLLARALSLFQPETVCFRLPSPMFGALARADFATLPHVRFIELSLFNDSTKSAAVAPGAAEVTDGPADFSARLMRRCAFTSQAALIAPQTSGVAWLLMLIRQHSRVEEVIWHGGGLLTVKAATQASLPPEGIALKRLLLDDLCIIGTTEGAAFQQVLADAPLLEHVEAHLADAQATLAFGSWPHLPKLRVARIRAHGSSSILPRSLGATAGNIMPTDDWEVRLKSPGGDKPGKPPLWELL